VHEFKFYGSLPVQLCFNFFQNHLGSDFYFCFWRLKSKIFFRKVQKDTGNNERKKISTITSEVKGSKVKRIKKYHTDVTAVTLGLNFPAFYFIDVPLTIV
jgi:hypothetical protein